MKTGLLHLLSTKVVKHAPAICVGVGACGVVVGAIVACKATKDHINDLEVARDIAMQTKRCKNEGVKVLASGYFKATKKYISIYAPSVCVIGGSLGFMIFGHKLLNKRHIALIGAYSALDGSFKAYRSRVQEAYGRDEDIQFLTGGEPFTITDVDTGETRKSVKINMDDSTYFIPDRDIQNGYFFMDGCVGYTDDPEANKEFLENMEEEANQIFNEQGYIFLNDVLAMVGIGATSAGAEVGWVKGRGDNFVSFGIYELCNIRSGACNGWEPVFLLDFNHDGYILPYL